MQCFFAWWLLHLLTTRWILLFYFRPANSISEVRTLSSRIEHEDFFAGSPHNKASLREFFPLRTASLACAPLRLSLSPT